LLFHVRDRAEKQRNLLGGGAITDGETDAKNASVDGPLDFGLEIVLFLFRSASRCCSVVKLSFLS
jgi:hypothetical protein